MIPNDQPLRKDMIERMLVSLETNNEKLSEWELDFVVSVREQFGIRSNLSDRQCEILERLYDKS
jgi:hypothetical protein